MILNSSVKHSVRDTNFVLTLHMVPTVLVSVTLILVKSFPDPLTEIVSVALFNVTAVFIAKIIKKHFSFVLFIFR